MLTASLISGVLGTKLPGLGSIYVKQDLNFTRPVRIGDVVTTSVEITDVDTEKKLINLKTQCYVGEKIVIDGKAVVLFPGEK
jgi:3-hydroxybutyryl-CoA dehydratase